MTQICERVHGGFYCIVWVLVSWKVNWGGKDVRE